jgi:hypothetical protein
LNGNAALCQRRVVVSDGKSAPAGNKKVSQPNAGNLTREDARVKAEIRCYAEFQAPDSCTRLPRCTDLPRYLELRFGHMRIIDNLLNLRPVGDVAVRDPADGLLNSPALVA